MVTPTPGLPTGDRENGEDTADAQVVSSDDEDATFEPSRGQQQVPGRLPGKDASSEGPTLPEGRETIAWQVYSNDEFGFEIQYPLTPLGMYSDTMLASFNFTR